MAAASTWVRFEQLVGAGGPSEIQERDRAVSAIEDAKLFRQTSSIDHSDTVGHFPRFLSHHSPRTRRPCRTEIGRCRTAQRQSAAGRADHQRNACPLWPRSAAVRAVFPLVETNGHL